MNPNAGTSHGGPTQRAQDITEGWVHQNMYCPACESDSLDRMPPSTKLIDFRCTSCDETFQLKSHKRRFGRRVLDSAWSVMAPAVRERRAPGFFFLEYQRESWRVSRLFIVPGHFITPQTLERKKTTPPTAHRPGWTGCFILLGTVPEEAKISVVNAPLIHAPDEVRERWRRFAFVKNSRAEGRGWLSDILACVERLDKPEFTLAEMYGFEDELRDRHPRNLNIQPKIRQQLQVLRRNGIVEFLGRGQYRLRVSSASC